ncbi:MbcA/ParS/Xre antitoxin family protein, partial [Burkholderia sp. SIMBA_019]
DEQARLWLTHDNLALGGKPLELIRTTEGLVRVVHYLDATRGRI